MSGYTNAIPADTGKGGGSAFLPKPFTPAELVDAVSSLVGPAS
jgi:DNA-binding response OmpR family regulator